MAYRYKRYGSAYDLYGGRYNYAFPDNPVQGYIFREAAKASRDVIRSLEDRRLWNPEPFLTPAPASYTRAARRLVVMPRVNPPQRSRGVSASLVTPQSVIGAGIGFAQPDKVAICVRRHSRREVLFAKGVGGGKVRRGKRNSWSHVQC